MSRHRNLHKIIDDSYENEEDYDNNYYEEEEELTNRVDTYIDNNNNSNNNIEMEDQELIDSIIIDLKNLIDLSKYNNNYVYKIIRESNYDLDKILDTLYNNIELENKKVLKDIPKPKIKSPISKILKPIKVISRAGASLIKIIPLQKSDSNYSTTSSSYEPSYDPTQPGLDINEPGSINVKMTALPITSNNDLKNMELNIKKLIINENIKLEESGLSKALGNVTLANNSAAKVDMNVIRPANSYKFDEPSPDEIHRKKIESMQFVSGNSKDDKKHTIGSTKTKVTSPTFSNEILNFVPSAKNETLRQKLLKEVADAEIKSKISMVVVGHVDAGKSTLMGHLLYLQGHLNEREMKQLEHEAKQIGKSSFAYAWVLDAHEEERSRGVTVDVALEQFETEHRIITLLDAPGHRDFIPNMISGASQADVAVLVIDVTPGGFDDGFTDGGQTKEHAILLRSLGISEMIIALNKIDLIEYSEVRFNTVVEHVTNFLKQSGFRQTNLHFIPVSGFTGENIVKRKESALNSWYNGPTLLEQIDSFQPPERLLDRPLRFCVADVYKSSNGAPTLGGKIEAGSIMVKDKVLVLPLGEMAVVKTVGNRKGPLKIGCAGENVEISLTMEDPSMLHVGQMLCSPDKRIPLVKHFEARILTLNFLIPILPGTLVDLHIQSSDLAAHISCILGTGKKDHNEKLHPRHITKQSVALVEIKTDKLICLELHNDYRSLGRFTLRREGHTIAVGVVTKIFD